MTVTIDQPKPLFAGDRATATARLAAFVPRAGRAYADTRNSDSGPDDRRNVSLLSPYVRHRLISEREIVAAVLDRHSTSAAEKFVAEVLWRTYWKGWLEMRPAVWRRYGDELAAIDRSSGLMRAVTVAERGETGIEGFDDWARELIETGYLHNHARMWFASIWIFTLRLPWVLGADFFARHLVDADPASNTLSWRWVAGLQTPGKTYLATADNIARYTGGRFMPKGLATSAQPLSEAPLPAAAPIAEAATLPDTPSLLLIHADDCSPEQFIDRSAVASVLVMATIAGRWPWGDAASAFVTAASADAAARARDHYAVPVHSAPAFDPDTIAAAARAAGVTSIITPVAPVGPVGDALAACEPELRARALTLTQVRRDWDSAFWPHARKGFFAFKEKIPALLAEQGIAA